jgi:MtN3 and saliva related transmembrane protein
VHDVDTTTTILGLAAATLTTGAFAPQLVRVLRTRSTDDLSLLMLATFNSGVVLWLVYGLRVHAMPIIVANVVTLAQSATLLLLKVRYDRASARSTHRR